jgi:hypothetical protein
MGFPSGLFPRGFPTKTLYTPLFCPQTCSMPTHLILLYFITCTIFGEQYRSLSCSLCSFLHSRYLVLLRPKYSHHHILQHPQPTFLPLYKWSSFTPIQNKQN